MWKPLEIVVSRQEGTAVLRLDGDFTAESGEIVVEAYESLIAAGTRSFVVDFEGVEHLNSGGLAVLVSMLSALQGCDGEMAFCAMAPHFQRIAHIVGLTDYVGVHDTQEDALKKRTS